MRVLQKVNRFSWFDSGAGPILPGHGFPVAVAVSRPRARESALDQARVTGETASEIVDENETARLRALRTVLAVIAIVAAAALFFSGRIATRQPGSDAATAERGPPAADPASA